MRKQRYGSINPGIRLCGAFFPMQIARKRAEDIVLSRSGLVFEGFKRPILRRVWVLIFR